MTEPLPLPGFGYDRDELARETPLESAVNDRIAQLMAAGLIGPAQVIEVEAIRAAARSMGKSAIKGQSVALAAASKELREWVALLPQAVERDEFAEWMDRLNAGSH
jgi:hypothetical protein